MSNKNSTRPQYAHWTARRVCSDMHNIIPKIYYQCSACKANGFATKYPFCPKCGTKMI